MKNFCKFRWLWSPLALMESLTLWGDSGGGTTISRTEPSYTPEERAAREDLLKRGIDIYKGQQGTLGQILQPSAETTASQQGITNVATGVGQNIATGAANATNFGLSSAVLDPNNTPGYQGALNAALRPVTNAYMDPGGVLSKIRGNFTAGNSGGSGTREGIASGIAGREYLNTVGDVSSRMSLDQYGKGLNFMKDTLSLAPNTYDLQRQPAMDVGAVGTQKEAYAQSQFAAPWSELQPYTGILQGFTGGGSNTKGSVPGVDNSMQYVAMAAMTIAMII